MWWAYNKKTGFRYGPYSDQERSQVLANPQTNKLYRWVEIPRPPAAAKPEGVKPAGYKKGDAAESKLKVDDNS